MESVTNLKYYLLYFKLHKFIFLDINLTYYSLFYILLFNSYNCIINDYLSILCIICIF